MREGRAYFFPIHYIPRSNLPFVFLPSSKTASADKVRPRGRSPRLDISHPRLLLCAVRIPPAGLPPVPPGAVRSVRREQEHRRFDERPPVATDPQAARGMCPTRKRPGRGGQTGGEVKSAHRPPVFSPRRELTRAPSAHRAATRRPKEAWQVNSTDEKKIKHGKSTVLIKRRRNSNVPRHSLSGGGGAVHAFYSHGGPRDCIGGRNGV